MRPQYTETQALALELGSKAEIEGVSRSLTMPQLTFLPITMNGLIMIAPNIALSKPNLIQSMVSSKLQ
jgi:hypothetical protein